MIHLNNINNDSTFFFQSILCTFNAADVKIYNNFIQWGKKTSILICSNFMSFSPIDFIFIGWIGYIWNFFWVLRNFDFKPANEIFFKKCKIPFFKKCIFWGYDLENWVWAKLVLWICPILWKTRKMVNTQLSLTFFY